jgi:DNA-binding PadR family transcriptional regulator
MKPETRRSRKATDPAPLAPAQAAKTLMVLGMLLYGAKHGYELHRVVVAHGSLYADFKKPTLYHLLHRLALQGAVLVRSEGGARGPRGERLVFALAPKGRSLFMRLLREALSSYDAGHITFEVASAFLGLLAPEEAQQLLRRRRALVRARRAEVLAENKLMDAQPASTRLAARRLAADHATMLMDAEIAWTDRAIRQLKSLSDPEGRPRMRRVVGQ